MSRRVPWVALAVTAACALASFLPGAATALQYDRARVEHGEVWRVFTGQMVHWTPRMAVADLAVVAALAAWLELRRGRPALLLATALGAGFTALGVQVFLPHLDLYRGSSGLASALFVLTALEAARRSSRAWHRGAALLALGLVLVKAGWESATGCTLAAGPLPPGVEVTPLVHLLGGLAGGIAFLGARAKSPQ